jgi:hypothetical protein
MKVLMPKEDGEMKERGNRPPTGMIHALDSSQLQAGGTFLVQVIILME